MWASRSCATGYTRVSAQTIHHSHPASSETSCDQRSARLSCRSLPPLRRQPTAVARPVLPQKRRPEGGSPQVDGVMVPTVFTSRPSTLSSPGIGTFSQMSCRSRLCSHDRKPTGLTPRTNERYPGGDTVFLPSLLLNPIDHVLQFPRTTSKSARSTRPHRGDRRHHHASQRREPLRLRRGGRRRSPSTRAGLVEGCADHLAQRARSNATRRSACWSPMTRALRHLRATVESGSSCGSDEYEPEPAPDPDFSDSPGRGHPVCSDPDQRQLTAHARRCGRGFWVAPPRPARAVLVDNDAHCSDPA